MIGSSGCPPLLQVFEGWVRQGSPLLAGILGLSSAESRPFRPRFAGGFRGISFRSRRAKHQENPRAKDRVQAPQMGQHRCPNDGKVPEFAARHKRLLKNFRQKFQAGDSECNKSSFLDARDESLRRWVNDLDMSAAVEQGAAPEETDSMNFASDNIVGASAPVLQALMRGQCGGACRPMATTRSPKRVKARFDEIFEREVVGLLRHDRDGRQCARARPPPCRPTGCASATGKRTSSTTNAARRNSSCMGQSSPGCRASAPS